MVTPSSNGMLAERFFPPCQKPSKTFMLRSGKVEAIKVHHLGPGRDEVFDKLLLRVSAGIDLGQRAQLGVRAEDQVDAGPCRLDLAGLTVAPLEHVLRVRDGLPLCGHV